MAEPMIFKITNQSAWNGTKLVDITRDAFQQKGRYYTTTIDEGGALRGDFFGLMSSSAPKLVSVAVDSFDPLVRARVTPEFDDDNYREELDLTPAFQTVFMASTDVIRVVSAASQHAGSRILTLIVNELSEAEAVRYAALRQRPRGRTLRARITRDDNQPFTNTTSQPLLSSPLSYNLSLGYLVATVSGQGYVSVKDLVDPGSEGVYVWVRFTGIAQGSGEVYLVDPRTDEFRSLESGLQSPIWSKAIWLAREDRLTFRTTNPDPNSEAAVECEVSHVRQRRVQD